MSDRSTIEILLVEDNPGDARLVREALRDADATAEAAVFRLRVVDRLQPALELLGREAIDVVLLDLSLPDSDGYATFQKVQAAAASDCAVVVLTRTDDVSLGTRAVRDGAQDFLTKAQFDESSFTRSLRHARDRKRAEGVRLDLARVEAARVEAAARGSMLQALFDSAQDAILIADDAGRYLDANGAAMSLLQRSREEILQLAIGDLAPGDAVKTLDAWGHFLHDGEQSGELTVRRPDGTSRVVEFRAKAHIQRGQHMSVMRDITDRKAGEAERAGLLDLARRERRRAEQANRAQDEFLGVVSHELRSPLNAILGWTRLVRSGTLSTEKVDRALETIERNAVVQKKLIEDILDTSRITTGKLRLELETTQIAAVAEEAADVVRPSADAKCVALHLLLSADLGEAQVDASRLQQIIWNLLANAVKFTPSGGRVELAVSRDGDAIEIRVSDTGTGIDLEFLPHVFDPFRQADSTFTRSSGGLGLGLSIVKHLVELHGGSVRAASEGRGRGSIFTVRLPLTLKRVPSEIAFVVVDASVPPRSYACPPELAGLRVLVVDDEEDARELLALVLGQCGMRVEVAGSADEGMAAVTRTLPELVICDIAMPIEDGYSFIARVRQLPPLSGGATPAIALTAHVRAEDRTRALRAGFTNHVGKPVDPTELFAVIGAATGRRALS